MLETGLRYLDTLQSVLLCATLQGAEHLVVQEFDPEATNYSDSACNGHLPSKRDGCRQHRKSAGGLAVPPVTSTA